MSEVGSSSGALIARGLELGWINRQQARAAWDSVQRARSEGRALRVGQALVALGALPQDRVLELLEACGWAVAACPRCRQAWNVPRGSALACPRDGAALQPDRRRLDVAGELQDGRANSRSSSGTRVDDGLEEERYQVERELARGGMGAVWLARDHFLARDVAMKVMLKQGRLRTLRFLEEARVTGQLDHPNIVPVHELGRRGDGRHFFTMKWVKGQALSALIARDFEGEEPVSLRRYLEVFTKILDAVAFAHAHDVIHRDLKPDNIMIGEFGEVYVMDWGLAKVRGRRDLSMEGLEDAPSGSGSGAGAIRSLRDADPQWTLDGALCGTLNYMPPEQADRNNEAVDERSDIYALGAILFEMLAGRPAFEAPRVQALISLIFTNQYQDPSRARDGRAVPPELVAVVRKALSLKPKDRYQSVLELRAEIEAFLDGRAVRARRDPTWTRIRRWARRRASLVSSLSLALLTLAALGFILFALPARLRLEIPDPPPGLEVFINGELIAIERGPGRAIAAARLWPPGRVEVAARAPNHDPAELSLSLGSRARETRLLQLRRWSAPLTIASPVGGLEARLSPGDGRAPVLLEAPFYERDLPTGDYQLELRGLDRFPLRRRVSLQRGRPERIDAELETVVLAELGLREALIDGRVADLNEDGRLELILALRSSVEVLDLGSRRLLWRRALVRNQERLRSRGSYLEVADVDGDGRCDVIAQDDTRIYIFDGATGDEKSRFTRFLCRVKAVDIDADGRAEILCATPYRGVQAFRSDGRRAWATQTPRYSDKSSLEEVALGGEDVGLIGLAHRPSQLYVLERGSGAVIWRRGFETNPDASTVSAFASGRGYDLIAAGAVDAVVALDARDGREAWRHELPDERVIGVTAGRFRRGEPPVLLVHTRRRLICLNRAGKELWRHEGSPQPRGAFGDIDGDGVKEWVVFFHDEARPDRWSLRALTADGALSRKFSVSKDSEEVAPIPPWIVDVYGDGVPCLLVLGRYRVRLIKLGPERGDFRELAEGFDYLRADLDGDGRSETVRYNSSLLEVSGATLSWKVALQETLDIKAFRARAALRLDAPEVADCDGDGIADFCLAAGNAVVVISGRDGRPLLVNRREQLPARPVLSAPLEDGRRLIFALTGREVLAIELDAESADGRLRFRVPYLKSDSGGVAIGGRRPGIIYCDRASELVRRDLSGAELWRRDLGAIISFGGVLILGERVYAPGSHGVVFALDLDGRPLWRVEVGGSTNILARRRGPEGEELLALGWSHALAFLDPRSGRLLRRFEAPELEGLGAWQVAVADIDGDRLDEVFLLTAQGHLTVLEGRSLERIFCTQRLLQGLDADVRKAVPPLVTDWDEDGRLDLLVQARRPLLLFDVPKLAARFGRPRFSDDPLIDMSYLVRELLRGEVGVVERRLAALGRGGALSLARGLAARYGALAGAGPGLENHRAELLSAIRAGRPLAPLVAESRRLFSDKLVAVFRALDRGGLKPEEVRAFEEHVRVAVAGSSPAALLAEARRRGEGGQAAAGRAILEVAARAFPDDATVRRRYVAAVSEHAIARHLSFDRTGPMEQLSRAVAVLDDARLRVTLGRITLSRVPNEPGRAAVHFDRAVALGGPERARALAHRALFLFQTRRPGPALNDIREALEAGAEDGEVLAIAGLLAAYQRQAGPALDLFERALKRGIDDPLELEARVYRTRCELYLAAGQPGRARRDFEAAVLRRGPSPQDNLDKRRLGLALCRVGRFAEGLPYLRDASVLLEGPLRLEVEREHRGYEALARSREIARPKDAAELAIFARAALFAGRVEEGRRLFEEALGMAAVEARPALLSELGRFEATRGDRSQGLARLTEALGLRGAGLEAMADRLVMASVLAGSERERARRLILEAVAAGAREQDLRDRGLEAFLEDPAVLAAFQR